MTHRFCFRAALVALLTCMALFSGLAHAGTLMVTTQWDSGPGSLRQVMNDAATTDDYEIEFAPELAGKKIQLQSTLIFPKSYVLKGPPGYVTLCVLNNSDYVFYVGPGKSLRGSRLIIEGTYIGSGSILNRGDMELRDCVQVGSKMGLINEGTMSLIDCTLTNNMRVSNGAAIANQGIATVERCTFVNNHALSGSYFNPRSGGAVYNAPSGQITFKNCTFTGNTAGYGGAVAGSATFLSCTLVDNTATEEGGGIYATGDVTLKNTLLARNTAPAGADWFRPLNNAGSTAVNYSLIGDTRGMAFSGSRNRLPVTTVPYSVLDPKIELNESNRPLLKFNGGPIRTIRLLHNSPALDAGSSYGITSDARGLPRPVDLPSKSGVGDQSDIGAFEQQPDAIAPQVSLLAPTAGQVFLTTTFPVINGTAVDNAGFIDRVEVLIYRKNSSNIYEYWNGRSWVLSSNSVLPATLTPTATGANWQLSSPLPAWDSINMKYGSIYLRVQAWDGGGNTTRIYSQFTLKNSTPPPVTPPSVTISSPAHGSRVTSSTFPELQGYAHDPSVSGITRVEVMLYCKNSSGVVQYWNGSAWVSSSAGCIL